MQTINDTNFCRYEIKKSIFIAYAAPIKEFENLNAQLRANHPKAAHIVWAYRKLNEFNQIVENGSDDGEPKGTSAQPILNVLRGAQLVNICILAVRYFGGVKLGTGGLVRAYSMAAKSVLNEAEIIPYEPKDEFIFSYKYSFVPRIEHFLQKIGADFGEREFGIEQVIWKLQLNARQKEELRVFLDTLGEM
ncbi:MAG: IMPACT family protein [Campylobacteraceae bacterium]|nr:IMPACT family protein [Campylobacteraceae bacterium]